MKLNFFLVLLILIGLSQQISSLQFQPNWGIYRKKIQYLTFTHQPALSASNTLTEVISLNIPIQNVKIKYHDGQNIILNFKTNSSQTIQEIKLNQNNIDQFSFQFKGKGKLQLFSTNKPSQSCNISKTQDKSWIYKLLIDLCSNCKVYTCNLPLKITKNPQKLQNWTSIENKHQLKLINFMNKRNISQLYKDITEYSIFQLMKSIKVIQQNPNFFLLSQNQNELQTAVRLSLLPIEIIGDYDYSLGKWLCQNFVNFYEKQLLYSGKQFYILPEHIQAIMKYYDPRVQDQRQKIQNLLIGIIDSILLAPVNHIEQQMNYRQSNKLHPTLFKMLSFKFQTKSPQLMASSIYSQSFLQDLFYHGPSKKLENSIAKYMWFMKVVALCQFYAPEYKNQLGYIQTIIKLILGEDDSAKKGLYRSTVIEGRLRFYVNDLSYQNLFQYSYGISSNIPVNVFQNLTTSYGLSSLPTTSINYNQDKYRYRGNVHLYYNYIFCFDKAHPLQTKNWQNIAKLISNLWKKDNQIYSIWTKSGKPLQTLSWLKIIAPLFLNHSQ